MTEKTAFGIELVQKAIHRIRGEVVMLDEDLARLYGVTTSALNQAVKRNSARFPDDFCFRLTRDEYEWVRSQNVIFNSSLRKYLPYVFTEEGVAMLSGVLKSDRAIEVNILIMRAFVRMRKLLAANAGLARKVGELEARVHDHDKAISVLFEEIRQLLTLPEEEPKQRIGFRTSKTDK